MSDNVNMHLIEYAIRYCITRESYAFEDGLDTAERYWDRLSHATRNDVVVEVIRRRHDVEQRWPNIATAIEYLQAPTLGATSE